MTSKEQNTQLTCKRCKYSWTFTGKAEYYASCPKCRTVVRIKEKIKPSTDDK